MGTEFLGELCDFEYGESLREDRRRPGKIPVYGSNGIIGCHDEALTNGPTIVIGRKGSIGEVHFSSGPCWPIDTTYYIERTKRPCDFRWLYHALIALDLTRLNRAAAVPGLNRADAYQKRIPFPHPGEQRRIAAILEKADRLRRMRRYARQLSDTFLQSVFLEMFGDPISNKMNWKKMRLIDICTIRRGASPRPIERFLGGTVPWIKIGDGTKGNQVYLESTEDFVTLDGARKSVFLKAGSLIFANCGVSLGFARILRIDGCIHDGWLSFENFEKQFDPLFFLHAINQITPHLRGLAPEGTQPNLNTGIMGNLEMIVPPTEEQRKFNQIEVRFEGLRTQQLEAERQAEHLFQTLLHRAFMGEL